MFPHDTTSSGIRRETWSSFPLTMKLNKGSLSRYWLPTNRTLVEKFPPPSPDHGLGRFTREHPSSLSHCSVHTANMCNIDRFANPFQTLNRFPTLVAIGRSLLDHGFLKLPDL